MTLTGGVNMIYKCNEQATLLDHPQLGGIGACGAPPRKGGFLLGMEAKASPPTLKVRRDTVIKVIPAAQPDKESKVGSLRPLVSNAVLWNICSS